MLATLALVLSLLPPGGADGLSQGRPGARELMAQLASADPAARAKAACALRELGDDAVSAVDALVALLSDGAPVERSVCERNWGRWDNEHTTTPGEQAASALVAIGSRTLGPLLAAVKHSSWIARRNAAWALGALDDRRAVEPLIRALKDTEAGVREQAAWALGAIGDSRALDALLPSLQDAHAGVRRQAAWAIGVLSR